MHLRIYEIPKVTLRISDLADWISGDTVVVVYSAILRQPVVLFLLPAKVTHCFLQSSRRKWMVISLQFEEPSPKMVNGLAQPCLQTLNDICPSRLEQAISVY